MQVGCNDKTRHHVSNKCDLASGPLDLLPLAPWCAYTNHAELKQVVSGTAKTTRRVPGSNAHHPCTNCSCSQPGSRAQLFRSSRQFASKYLEAFKASRRILQSRLIPKVLAKTAKFRDDLNMAKKKNPVKSKLVVFAVQTVCKCSRYISKKQEKKHTDATQIWVPSSYFGTEPFAVSLVAFHFGQPNLFKFVKAHVRTFHKLIL